MPRINKYDVDSTLHDGDKLLGTDGPTGATKNYTLEKVSTYVQEAVGLGTQGPDGSQGGTGGTGSSGSQGPTGTTGATG